MAGEWGPAFILAGGPSVKKLDLSLLNGRRVIAINSAWRAYPAADVLFYADGRWWREIGSKGLPGFSGEIVTTGAERPKNATLRKKLGPRHGLSEKPGELALQWTSVSGGINEAVHRGSRLIVLLGVDGKEQDGRRHHHGDRYPWPVVNNSFDKHAAEFAQIAPWLAARGVTVVNANPDSAINVWPKVSFEEALRMADGLPVVNESAEPGEVIRIFVGCAANGEDAESQAVLEWSIRKRASMPVEITWMMQSRDPQSFWSGFDTSLWKTPFSGFRWAIPAACNYEGRAIYMDSDVIVMADVAELWRQAMQGHAVLAKHGGRLCVSLWDCAAAKKHVLDIKELRSNPQQHGIMQGRTRQNVGGWLGVFAGEWNCLDGEGFQNLLDPRLKAIHYTEMSTQPHLEMATARLAKSGLKHWMDGHRWPHPRGDLSALFDRLFHEAEANSYTVDKYIPKVLFGEYRKASLKDYGKAPPKAKLPHRAVARA